MFIRWGALLPYDSTLYRIEQVFYICYLPRAHIYFLSPALQGRSPAHASPSL